MGLSWKGRSLHSFKSPGRKLVAQFVLRDTRKGVILHPRKMIYLEEQPVTRHS